MKYYQLFYSFECDSVETYELKKFIRRNNLNYKIDFMPFRDGKDGIKTITHLTNVYFQELAEQSLVLPLKLRYFLLLETDSEDKRLATFVMGKDNIISYLPETLL